MDCEDWDPDDSVGSENSSSFQSWSFSLPFSSLPQFPSNPIPHLAQNLQGIRGYFPSNLNLPIFTSAMTSIPVPSMISSFPSMPSMPSMASIPSMVSSALSSVSFQDTPRKDWTQLKESVRRTQRKLFEISGRLPFAYNFAPLQDKNGQSLGTRIYFLCTHLNGCDITLHYCDVIDNASPKSVSEKSFQGRSSATPPRAIPASPKHLRRSSTRSPPLSCDHESEDSTSSTLSSSSRNESSDDSERVMLPVADYDWKLLIDSNAQSFNDAESSIPEEQKLLLERKRIMFYGITSYEFHSQSRRFVFSCCGNLFYFDDIGTPPYTPIQLKSSTKCAKINPVICPSNPDLIAYHSDGDIWAINIKTSQELRLTSTKFNENRRALSAGNPCYVIQEEFHRHHGFWWRPGYSKLSSSICEYDILYEEVDETQVETLYLPNAEGGVDKYRFPRAGGVNASSDLKLVTFKYDTSSEHLSDSSCQPVPGLLSLFKLYRHYEYLVRCNWYSRDCVWVQLLNRQQKHLVLGLFSLSKSFPPQILLREDSPFRISVNDFIHFISPYKTYSHKNTISRENFDNNLNDELLKPGSEVKFFWISVKTGFRHLYVIKVQLVACGEETLGSKSVSSKESSSASSPRRLQGGPNNQDAQYQSQMKASSHFHSHHIHYPHHTHHSGRITEGESLLNSSSELESALLNCKELTSGEWEIDSQDIWVDEANQLIYFVATKDTPLERHLYCITYAETQRDEKSFRRITKLTESGFSHTTIAFNSDFDLFVNIQSNISYAPFGYVNKKINASYSEQSSYKRPNKRTSTPITSNNCENCINFEKKGLVVNNCLQLGVNLSMGSSSTVQVDVDTIPGMGKPELFEYKLKSSGDSVFGLIFKPEFMDPGVKYPCVLDIYGGPEVQTVTNSFKSARQPRRHMLSNEGYVVVSVDCRGTHNRGMKFEAHVHGRVGQVEIADQVEVLTWLAKNVGYIDMTRVAIHGWSYGGYLALMGLAQRPDIFRLAVAGAPVIDWSLYDTGYTERYLDSPHANPTAYEKGNVLNYVNSFPDQENRLLLVHGLMDENVHFIHTQQLIKALIRAGKPYTLQIFPSERHSLRNPSSFEYNETFLLSFLEQHLKPIRTT